MLRYDTTKAVTEKGRVAMNDGLVMLGIMLFVLIAQGALWAWVFIQRRNRIPDVKIMNLRELYDLSRQSIDAAYRRSVARRQSRARR